MAVDESGAIASVVRVGIWLAGEAREGAGSLAALRELGRQGEVELELVRDVRGARDLAEGGELDLLVIEDPGAPGAAGLLAALREAGPACIAVTAAGDDAAALAAFRAGARNCVSSGPAFSAELPRAAIAELRRHRQARESAWLAQRIGRLQRYDENILQHLNAALLAVDLHGRITFANASAGSVLGAAGDELEGRPVWDWFGEDGDGSSCLARTLREGVRFRGAEIEMRRSDGAAVPVGISCAPLLDDAGVQEGAVAVFQDLSEIGQLREQLLQSEKMASIGQLAAGVAHEINNPVGFIHANLYQMSEYIGDIEVLWSRVDELGKAVESGDLEIARARMAALRDAAAEVDVDFVLRDLGKAVRESQEGSERIRHIVQDLRDFARQDSGELAPADLNGCVDSTASIAWTMMKHSVVLEKAYGDLPQVRCNAMQLKQMVMNLLVNACQAIQARHGDSGELGRIVVRTRRDGDDAVVEIEDSGVGFGPEIAERLFDPFFTTKEVGEGTGLGLSTSYNIVRRHGGSLRAEGRPGEGACFTLRLPICGPGVEAQERP